MNPDQILVENGIEFKPESNYNTICPKCSDGRNKADQKCLKVFIEDKAVVWQCYHNECDWNQRQVKYMDTPKHSIKVKEIKTQLWSTNGKWDEKIKKIFDESIKYPYYNKDEQLSFYILRTGDKEDKQIRPISLGTDGKYHLTRPTGMNMPYRFEFFDPSKPTLIVEGEKAADYAAKIAKKSNVLSWVGGSNAVKQTDWSILGGNEVTLWPDNDEGGKKAMEQLVEVLLGCRSIPSKIYSINVDVLPPKFDIADIADMDLIGKLFKDKTEIQLDQLSSHQFTLDRLFNEFTKKDDYIKFGWDEVDNYVQIPEPGLTVFTARTNHGKTNAMINVATNILKQGTHTVLYVSYEESGKKVGKRFLKTLDPEHRELNHIDYDNFLTNGYINGNIEFIEEFKQYIQTNRLRLYDVATPITVIVSTLNRLKALNKPTVCILDYAQRLPSLSNQQRYLAIKEQMEELVNLANLNEQAIITAAQVTASENHYADAARESKDIENSADLVIGVWNKISGDARGAKAYDDVPGDIVWSIKKARQDKAVGKRFGFMSPNGCNLKPASLIVELQTNKQEF